MKPAAAPGPLHHLTPGWYAIVMGLAGLSLAWHRAVPLLGQGAAATASALGAAAAAVFALLASAGVWRMRRHPGAWGEDLRHPVRHAFVAAVPISMILLATAALAAGIGGPWVEALWALGAIAQLSATAWVLSRWWRGPTAGGLAWAGVTPVLFIPIVGNVLAPLAGVPLGHPDWSAAQFGVGVLFWPVVLVLMVVRIAQVGPWPERLLPAGFILVAPPAVVGLSLLQFGAPVPLGWAAWGIAVFMLLWVLPLARRIAALPFGLPHWGLSFPLAALTALTLRLMPSGTAGLAGLALLAASSLVVLALVLGTLRGLRDGSLLVAEPAAVPGPVAAMAPAPGAGTPAPRP